jgi:hypothetical protein
VEELPLMTDIELLKVVVELLRANGVKIKSPYDLENWIEDNVTHSRLFKTGLFGQIED